jgi:hypothetical protein
MADKVLVGNSRSALADTVEVFYTAPSTGSGTRIKAFTASNNTESSANYKAYIYPAAGPDPEPVIPQTIVVRDRADNGAAIINQVIPAGGTLRMESSDANSINFYVTGVDQ